MHILDGIRVLDFGRFIAGPFCGALLGDLGADVIRVEKVAGSEDRFTAPVGEGGPGSGYLALNRNKRGFTLNPRKPEGQEVLRRLVASADVVIANLPPDTLAAMGMDYESLKAIKPNIILTTTTAYGASGPYGTRVGFDGVAQAMSGNMHLTGHADEPMKNYYPYVDYTTGTLNAFATLAALIARKETGRGQQVQSSLLGSALTVANGTLIEQALLNVNRVGTGNRGQTTAPSDAFQTRDGWILVQVVGNPLFERWANLMGAPHWLTDPRYASDEARGDNAEDISDGRPPGPPSAPRPRRSQRSMRRGCPAARCCGRPRRWPTSRCLPRDSCNRRPIRACRVQRRWRACRWTSAAPRRASAAGRPRWANTRTKSSPSWVSMPPPWPNCGASAWCSVILAGTLRQLVYARRGVAGRRGQ